MLAVFKLKALLTLQLTLYLRDDPVKSFLQLSQLGAPPLLVLLESLDLENSLRLNVLQLSPLLSLNYHLFCLQRFVLVLQPGRVAAGPVARISDGAVRAAARGRLS